MDSHSSVYSITCTAFTWSERTRTGKGSRGGKPSRESTAVWRMPDEKLLDRFLLLLRICREDLDLDIQRARDGADFELARDLGSRGILPVLDRCDLWPRLTLEFLWRSNSWAAVESAPGFRTPWWPPATEPRDFRRKLKLTLLRAVKFGYISAPERAALEAKLINWETYGIHRADDQAEEVRPRR